MGNYCSNCKENGNEFLFQISNNNNNRNKIETINNNSDKKI